MLKQIYRPINWNNFTICEFAEQLDFKNKHERWLVPILSVGTQGPFGAVLLHPGHVDSSLPTYDWTLSSTESRLMS